jgi:hypothetical protein
VIKEQLLSPVFQMGDEAKGPFCERIVHCCLPVNDTPRVGWHPSGRPTAAISGSSRRASSRRSPPGVVRSSRCAMLKTAGEARGIART